MTDIDSLPEWVEGAEYPAEVSGWHQMTLKKYTMEAKDRRIWLRCEFSNGSNVRADLSQNIFTQPATPGETQANNITMSRLKDLWKAYGLTESEWPAATKPRDIAKALMAYEGGNQPVDVRCKVNDRGYTEAVGFRKVKAAE